MFFFLVQSDKEPDKLRPDTVTYSVRLRESNYAYRGERESERDWD